MLGKKISDKTTQVVYQGQGKHQREVYMHFPFFNCTRFQLLLKFIAPAVSLKVVNKNEEIKERAVKFRQRCTSTDPQLSIVEEKENKEYDNLLRPEKKDVFKTDS